ncbi:MAG TPA: hypothetical protein VKB03_10145 [Conexibacter sp.]|nr:hypothetical protein [Conexibacter sp.]
MSENALVAALLALALAGVASRVAGVVQWGWDHGPFGRSATERAVDALLDGTAASPFWRVPPHVSSGTRGFLVAHWGKLDPDRVHPYSTAGAVPVDLDRLLEDRALDGRKLAVDGFVSYVLSTNELSGGRLRQVFQLMVGGRSSAAWCRTTLPTAQQVHVDDEVHAVAVVLARGAADLGGGGFVSGTSLACPAVTKDPAGVARVSVAHLFDETRTDGFWDIPPDLSDSSRTFLVAHWSQYDPYVLHDGADPKGPSVPFERLRDNPAAYDGRSVTVGGWVEDVSTHRGADGVFQTILLQVGGSDIDVWCYATRPRDDAVRIGPFARVTGVVVARGSTNGPHGGYHPAILMTCPAIRLYR